MAEIIYGVDFRKGRPEGEKFSTTDDGVHATLPAIRWPSAEPIPDWRFEEPGLPVTGGDVA